MNYLDTYLDTRDLEARRQELEDELETLSDTLIAAEETCDDAEIDLEAARQALRDWDDESRDELDALNNLRDNLGHRTWRDGIILLPKGDFKDYARDIAASLFGPDIQNSSWLLDCIDWEQAADALRKAYYCSVEYAGVTYLYRN